MEFKPKSVNKVTMYKSTLSAKGYLRSLRIAFSRCS